MCVTAARTMFVLNAPQRPRSAVMTMTAAFVTGRAANSGWAEVSTRGARCSRSAFIFRAYGRAAMTASCARRSFAAATIFIALVIFCVLFTLPIRRRISLSVAMRRSGLEAGDELPGDRVELLLEILREVLLHDDLVDD